MPPFDYIEAQSLDEAVALLSQPGVVAIGGGTDLLPQVMDGVVAAERIVGLSAIRHGCDSRNRDAVIGPASPCADARCHPRRSSAGTPALARHRRTGHRPRYAHEGTHLAGNLNQRPRCWYYRSPLIPCLKKGGDRCYALAGNTRLLCVTGGDRCYIVHPSDTAVALTAFDARIEVAGPNGEREMPIGDFFAGPGQDVLRENVLDPGDLITRILLPADAPDRSVYLKLRERESGDFALISVAAALSVSDDGVIRQARIALGGVAPVPYRATDVEAHVTGRPVADVNPAEAAGLALPNATPLTQNGYKLPMARNTVKRALTQLLGNA